MNWKSLGEILGVFSTISLGPAYVLSIVLLICFTHVVIKWLDVHQNIKSAELNSGQKKHKQKNRKGQ